MGRVDRAITIAGVLGLPIHVTIMVLTHPVEPLLAYAIFLLLLLGFWQSIYSIVLTKIMHMMLHSAKPRLGHCVIIAGNLMLFLTLSVLFPRSIQNVYLFSMLMVLSVPYLALIASRYLNCTIRECAMPIAVTNTIFIVLALALHGVLATMVSSA